MVTHHHKEQGYVFEDADHDVSHFVECGVHTG